MAPSILSQFKAARRVSTPLIAIRTADPRATARTIQSGLINPPPMFCWDAAAALTAANSAAEPLLTDFANGQKPALIRNPADVLNLARNHMPDGAILFFQNAHRFLDNPVVMQSVWNLRDEFTSTNRMLVMLCSDITLPAELKHDVVIFDESLPDKQDLLNSLCEVHKDAEIPLPSRETLEREVDALLGLPTFAAEQSAAMCLTREGMDIGALWERKRRMIEQTPGLSIYRDGQTFSDVAGYENAKNFLLRVLAGKRPPRAVVFIDEIEKMFTGLGNDTSGVTASLLGTLLTFMQDTKATGSIFIGPPGSGKSLVAKATGNTGEIPTISFDLTGMKGGLVGQSEQQLRTALKVVNAVAQGQTLFIATCNSIHSLPPELRRRFKFGTFFFDLPTANERAEIWKYYQSQYELAPHQWACSWNDEGWTGAEIAQCVENAYTLDCTIEEAAAYVVPVSVSARQEIEDLRTMASGKFLSASYPGLYDRNRNVVKPPRRAITLEEAE